MLINVAPRARPAPVEAGWLRRTLHPFMVIGAFAGAVAAIYAEFAFFIGGFGRLTGLVIGIIVFPVAGLVGGALGALAGPALVIAGIAYGLYWWMHHR